MGQMLKACCPVIVLIVMFLAGVSMPSRPSIWCALVIVAGTLVEVTGELHATAFGLFLMLFTEVAEAIFLVMSQSLLQDRKLSVLEGLYVFTGPSVAVLAIPAAITEWKVMVDAGHHRFFVEHPLEILASGFLGVTVNFLSFFVVQLSSPATLKLLNIIRCIGLVIFCVIFFGETCTALQISGYTVSLIGFVGYNFFQMRRDAASAVEDWVSKALACPRVFSRGEPADADRGAGP